MISKTRLLFKSYSGALAVYLSVPCLCLYADPVVTQFTDSERSSEIVVAADNSGNAIVVLVDDEVVKTSFSSNGGGWSPLENLSVDQYADTPRVAMNATGTALAAWRASDFEDPTNYSINTAYYTGGSWQTPTPDPLFSSTSTLNFGLSLSMNSLGNGLVLWVQDNVYVSFFSGGTWSPSVNIGPDLYPRYTTTAYSQNGNASALWALFDLDPGSGTFIHDLYANTFNGTSWEALPVLLDNNVGEEPDSGIDDLGNTIAVWSGGVSGTDIVTSRFDGLSWSALETLSDTPDNRNPKIAVAFDGTAVVVWQDTNNIIQMNLFDGTVWSGQIVVAEESEQPAVTMDDSGNALIGFVSFGDGYFGTMAKGTSTVENITFISSAVGANDSFDLALSNNSSVGFAVWSEYESEFSNTFGARLLVPDSPTGLQAQVCSARFAGVLDCENALTWVASIDPDVDHYDIYRENVLIGSVLASDPLEYADITLCKSTVVYSVAAVNSLGVSSDPISVTVGP